MTKYRNRKVTADGETFDSMSNRPRGRAIKRPEQDLQIQIAHFLRLAAISPARWWHVPNGVGMSKTQRAMRQKMGLTSGVHDLHFAWNDGEGPCFGTIELKAGRGTMTPEQKQFASDLLVCGHAWAECRTLEDVIVVLHQWDFPLRNIEIREV